MRRGVNKPRCYADSQLHSTSQRIVLDGHHTVTLEHQLSIAQQT